MSEERKTKIKNITSPLPTKRTVASVLFGITVILYVLLGYWLYITPYEHGTILGLVKFLLTILYIISLAILAFGICAIIYEYVLTPLGHKIEELWDKLPD